MISKQLNSNISKQISKPIQLQKQVGCFNHTVITWLHADKLMSILTRASLLYRDTYKTIYVMYINNRDLNTMTISVKTSIVSTTCSSEPNKQHALRSVCIHNIVQMSLGHPVTLVSYRDLCNVNS